MRNSQPEDRQSRRNFFRIAAGVFSASAAAVSSVGRAAAAGRHSDLFRCLPCLLRGTEIETTLGLIQVEDLKIGDLVITHSGKAKPIKWIGTTSFEKGPGDHWDERIEPIRVLPSAIEIGVPNTDLYISPEHALLLDGFLIPVKHLVNGVNIQRSAPVETASLEYYHIEFEQHQVMYAQGVPVESLLVTAEGRQCFTNADEFERLYGSSTRGLVPPYAPVLRHKGGPTVGALRSLVSTWVEIRDPIQIVYDRILGRAEKLAVPSS